MGGVCAGEVRKIYATILTEFMKIFSIIIRTINNANYLITIISICILNVLTNTTSYGQVKQTEIVWREYLEATSKQDYEAALKPISLLVKQFREISNEVNKDTIYAIYLGFQADIYEKLGIFDKAILCYKEQLLIFQNVLGDTSIYAILTTRKIILIYNTLNQDSLSINYQKELISIYNKTHFDDIRELAGAHEHLAYSYLTIKDLTSAEKELTSALIHYRKDKKNSKKELLYILKSLDAIYEEEGDYNKSIINLIEALELTIEIYGIKHEKTSVLHNNIATTYNKLFEFKKAKYHMEESLKICEEINGKNNINCLTCLSNISLLFADMGDYTNAINYANMSNIIRQNYFGKSSKEMADGLTCLGSIKFGMGKLDDAISIIEEAIEIYNYLKLTTTVDYSIAQNNLAQYYKSKGDFDRALQSQLISLEIDCHLFFETHPRLAQAYNNRGSLFHEAGSLDSALYYYEKALGIKNLNYGEGHPATALELNNIATVYSDLGRFQEAISLYTKTLNIYIEKVGENQSATAIAYNNIAYVYGRKGDFQKSIYYYEKSERILSGLPFKKKADWALVKNNLGTAYSNIGNDEMAVRYYENALELYRLYYGKDNHHAAVCLNNLAMTHERKKEYKLAIEYQKKL
ncbi:MAG: tetratricopeptide repeat protein [Bacteroidetes bacterium]|nr:tetratricopeptide repeat protein [Bacteroidota bacterium]